MPARTRSIFVLSLASLPIVCAPAFSQGKLPNDPQQFISWCSERGLTGKDEDGTNCESVIAGMVAGVAIYGAAVPENKACMALQKKYHPNKWKQTAHPIFEWLRSHSLQSEKELEPAIIRAVVAVYGCRPQ